MIMILFVIFLALFYFLKIKLYITKIVGAIHFFLIPKYFISVFFLFQEFVKEFAMTHQMNFLTLVELKI